MSYLISLDLPLWVAFILLSIAFYLAFRNYKFEAMYYQTLDRYGKAKSEYHKTVEALNGKLRNYVSLSEALQMTEQAKIVTDKLYKAESEAVEREALIVQLNKKIKDLDLLADFNETLANTYKSLSDRKQDKIERLKSDDELRLLQIDELIETIGNLDQERKSLQADLAAAIAVINRTKRATKQWGKYEAAKKAKLKGQMKTIIDDGKIEGIVYDSVGVPRIVKADQSENDNGRHDVLKLSNEVVRGVKEQAEAIRNELQADKVDLSELEVGDSIEFRDKSIGVVTRISVNDGSMPYFIRFKIGGKQTRFHFYFRNGFWADDKEPSSSDIVRIIKKSDV